MSKNKINVYINSKHYEKSNDFEVSFPPATIKCDPKTEYIVLNVNGWIMKNDFYNTQDGNNQYSIDVSNLDDSGVISYLFTIVEGNYNVLEMLEILQSDLSQYNVEVSYDDNINKYRFKNLFTDKKVKLNSDTAYDFLGLEKGESYDILPNEIFTSVNPINMAGDELVCLQIPNLQKTYPVLDDFKSGEMKKSDIIAYLSINAPPYALLEYKNWDGGDSFSYRLENTEIDTLRLVCLNQDLQNIKVGDYQLNLQFEIHKRITEYDILKKLERLVSNIFLIAGGIIEDKK
jgi:hypothetical protein